MENNPANFLIKELVLHPRRHWKSWLLILTLAIITYGGTWLGGIRKGENNISIDCSQQVTQNCDSASKQDSFEAKKEENNCVKKTFSDNEKEWEAKFYNKDKDGFWCPVKFLDPLIWYKEGIDTNFQKISLEYKIKRNTASKINNPPSFIFAYGKEGKNEVPIFKLWVPENPNLQLFGFAKNLNFDSGKPILEREDSVDLPDPVKTERNDTFTITSTRVEGNEMLLDFSYHYTSDVNKEDQNKNIPKIVKLPVSNAQASSKKFSIGIGTYVGNCIGEISYEICQ